MSKFSNHIKALANGNPISEVLKDKVNATIEFNNTNPNGLYVFLPCRDYEESFDKYMSLPHRLKLQSDKMCNHIWGVTTNMELFNMWHDHINGIGRDSEMKLIDASNELLKDTSPIKRSDISALLTPYEITSKGAYNDDKEKNFYRVLGEIDVLDGTDIKIIDWYNAYKIHVARISSDLWEQYYFAWKNTIIRLINDLKDLNLDMNSRLKKCQSLLELGWIPDVEFKEANLIANNINKDKQPIDLTNIQESLLDTDADVDFGKVIFIVNVKGTNDTLIPYLTTDFKTMYSVNLIANKLIRYDSNIVLRSFDTITVIGFLSNYNIRDEVHEVCNKVAADPTSTMVENQLVITKNTNLTNIMNAFMSALPIDNLHMVKLMYGDYFILYKDSQVSDLDLTNIYNSIKAVRKVEQCEENVIDIISKNPTALTLYKYKELAENTLVGYNYDYFKVLYENVIGDNLPEDILNTVINENALLKEASMSAINESTNIDDAIILEFNKQLKVLKESKNKIDLAYEINSSIEDQIYNKTHNENTKVELYRIREEVLMIMSECLNNGESIDNHISIQENVHINIPIKYGVNLLR